MNCLKLVRFLLVRRPYLLLFLTASLVLTALAGESRAGTIRGRVLARWIKDPGNVVVFIARIDGKTFEPQAEARTIDQVNKEFIPRVLPLLKGGGVTFHNSDPFLHNVHVYKERRSLFNFGMVPGFPPITKTFPEVGEVVILCDVHPEMVAYVLVLETPYSAVTDKAGRYEIPNVPLGTHILTTWHEKLKPVSKTVTVEDEEPSNVDFELE